MVWEVQLIQIQLLVRVILLEQQSTAKVNASAGFSIVTLNGTGSVLTFGHGLGVKPDAVILKARNIANNWLLIKDMVQQPQHF